MATTKCAGCGTETTEKGRKEPFCFECEKGWQDSPERKGMITARQRYIERVHKPKEPKKEKPCLRCGKFGHACKECPHADAE